MSLMAMCRKCDEPLISTMAWSKFEFYCLCCGAHYGWLEPKGVEDTPEVTARHEELQAEWDEITRSKDGRDAPLLIGGGVMLKDCRTCDALREPHWMHATQEEKNTHIETLRVLEERAKKEVTA